MLSEADHASVITQPSTVQPKNKLTTQIEFMFRCPRNLAIIDGSKYAMQIPAMIKKGSIYLRCCLTCVLYSLDIGRSKQV